MKRSSALRLLCAWASVVAIAAFLSSTARAYPIDEYERTGIRRLKYQDDVAKGVHAGSKLVPGATWPGRSIKLRMRDSGRDYELSKSTPKDPALQKALESVLKTWSWHKYNVAVLDITDPQHPRFAGVNELVPQTPGSVAKVLVASALLAQLRARFPDDIAAREKMLKSHVVTADDWAMYDTHEVPIVTGEKLDRVVYRKVRTGDAFSLWEWMDHALSPSNNAAAAMVWREATVMKLLGGAYPPQKYDAALWAGFGRSALTNASFAVVDEPLLEAGLSPDDFKLRLYFTTGAGKYIRSSSCSVTPLAMIQWMLRVEQGRMVDEWSSLELKKMLYFTKRRVRYLYTHMLDPFATFFKSGSLYRFTPKARRLKYRGDLVNVLNSLVEIDTTRPETSPDTLAGASPPEPPYVYIVAVMSNELKRNAAMDHARLAEALHGIVTAREHAPPVIPASPDDIKVPDSDDSSDDSE